MCMPLFNNVGPAWYIYTVYGPCDLGTTTKERAINLSMLIYWILNVVDWIGHECDYLLTLRQ